MGANDRSRDDVRTPDGRHLSEDQLNRFIDRDLGPDEHRRAELHLAQCAECSATLAELQSLVTALRELPMASLPRSFQLGTAHANAREPAWRRWGAALLPLLPALRAGTLALVLLLGGITAVQVIDDDPTSQQDMNRVTSDVAAPTGTQATFSQSTTEAVSAETVGEAADVALKTTVTGDTADEEATEPATDRSAAGAPAPEESDDAAPVEDSGADADAADSTQIQQPAAADEAGIESEPESDSGGEENTAMIAMEAASPEASPTSSPSPTATATATAVPTDTPAATPTPAAAPALDTGGADDDSDWLDLAQVALLAAIVALGTIVGGLTLLQRRLR